MFNIYMIRPIRQIAVAMISGLFLAAGGCTTLLRGTEQTMNFKTDPTAATVKVDDRSYTTPAEVQLKRRTTYDVTISKEGYRTIEFKLTPEIDGISLIGNFIMPGGSVGLVIDNNNGSDKRFYGIAQITLTPTTQPSEPPLKLKAFKGQLLNEEQYAEALRADRNDRSKFFQGQP